MKRFVLTAVMLAGLVFSVVLFSTPRVQADDQENSEIARGFAIAPVHLNLRGKDRALVGLGSYIVNAQ